MGDGVELSPDRRHFKLLGRMDRLVKVAEQRVSLPEMEDRIRQLDGIDDAALVVLEGGKGPFLGAVIVASGQKFKTHDAQSVLEMRSLLRPVFPKGTVPRLYRFVPELPRNPQGKIIVSELKSLLALTLERDGEAAEKR